MSSSSTLFASQSIVLPISTSHRERATQFAAEQATAAKAQQVWLNTVAVLVMQDYCQLLDLPTDLAQSDAWNPLLRQMADVADLPLGDRASADVSVRGSLECRPVIWSEDQELDMVQCSVPPEVWHDRLGYVLVGIDPQGKTATVLGFKPTVEDGVLMVDQLQPLTEFLIALEPVATRNVPLLDWLRSPQIPGWLSPQELLQPLPDPTPSQPRWPGWRALWQRLWGQPSDELSWAFRGPTALENNATNLLPPAAVAQAKLVDVGMTLGKQQVTLLIALNPEADDRLHIFVQLHPQLGSRYLPENLSLSLVQGEQTLQTSVSRLQDICLQLRPFHVATGTAFDIQLTLRTTTITERFVV